MSDALGYSSGSKHVLDHRESLVENLLEKIDQLLPTRLIGTCVRRRCLPSWPSAIQWRSPSWSNSGERRSIHWRNSTKSVTFLGDRTT